MSIGPDIQEVLAELGTAITLHPYGGTPVPAGHIDFVVFTEHSTPFTRMFLHSATTQYDTIVNIGDVVSWGGNYYLTTNKKPVEFENEVIEYEMLFYFANVTGSFHRLSETPTYDADYKLINPWTPYAENVHVTLSENDIGKAVGTNEQISSLSSVSNFLYVSAVHDIKIGDRFILTAERQFQIETIDDLMYQGVNVCVVKEDLRG